MDLENILDQIPYKNNIVIMERLIGHYIFDPELTEGKMIFLTGPLQVGKTTFAQRWLNSERSEGNYFNWDDPSIMVAYRRNPLLFKNFLDERFIHHPVPLVFDEIHKHREWRNILKGLFDTNRERIRLLVTGSARLEFARKSGDSLLGRYFSFQMFPIGLPEVVKNFSYILNSEEAFSEGELLASRARMLIGPIFRSVLSSTHRPGVSVLRSLPYWSYWSRTCRSF